MIRIHRGHMTTRRYWGLHWGRWSFFTIWTNPLQIQGPGKSFRTRD